MANRYLIAKQSALYNQILDLPEKKNTGAKGTKLDQFELTFKSKSKIIQYEQVSDDT